MKRHTEVCQTSSEFSLRPPPLFPLMPHSSPELILSTLSTHKSKLHPFKVAAVNNL
ncbi:hypothetical protein KAREA_49020 [Prescottella equi]|nr:hypothetical protein KAREA_49020 [Prescottella equi]